MNYGSWTVPELQAELRCRSVRVSGRKAELVERLQGLDAIHMKGASPSLPPLPPSAPSSPWPEAGSFRTMTNNDSKDNLPDVTERLIEQYVLYRQANDYGANHDVSAMKEGQRLFQDKVQAMSQCTWQERFFFCGTVEAAMKKHVSYSIKISLSKVGEVLLSSCECPAGMGPHSTYVQACRVRYELISKYLNL